MDDELRCPLSKISPASEEAYGTTQRCWKKDCAWWIEESQECSMKKVAKAIEVVKIIRG